MSPGTSNDRCIDAVPGRVEGLLSVFRKAYTPPGLLRNARSGEADGEGIVDTTDRATGRDRQKD